MRRLVYHAGRARPVIVYPFALILGFLIAYAWYLVIAGIILPVFVRWSGPTRTSRRATFANARAPPRPALTTFRGHAFMHGAQVRGALRQERPRDPADHGGADRARTRSCEEAGRPECRECTALPGRKELAYRRGVGLRGVDLGGTPVEPPRPGLPGVHIRTLAHPSVESPRHGYVPPSATLPFPDGFRWAVATSANQMECSTAVRQ